MRKSPSARSASAAVPPSPPVRPTTDLSDSFGVRDERLEQEYRRLVELSAQDDAERERGISLLKVVSGDPYRPYIALTFDDGPHGPRTLVLLEILRRLNVPATFFVVGAQARKRPEIVERISLDGHEIGNHTFHHYRLTRVPLDEVPDELNRTRELLRGIIGVQTRLFRPPGGEYDAAILRTVERLGYVTILWTDDPADYKQGRTPQQIEQLVLRDITRGGIILLHDGVEATLTALPRLVARLRARGYIFVTVSELIQRSGGLMRTREYRISRTAAPSLIDRPAFRGPSVYRRGRR